MGRLLAETFGWELVDVENLRAQGNVDGGSGSTSRAHADRTWRIEALSAAINLWIYEWRDVAVLCPVLTEGEQRQLSGISSLVKVVYQEEFHATGRTCVSDRPVGAAISQSPVGSHTSRNAERDGFTLNLSRPAEEIIVDLTAVLMTVSARM